MRIDACRKCGMELKTQKKCKLCNKPTAFHCVSCNYLTDEQLHFQCSVPLLEIQSGNQ